MDEQSLYISSPHQKHLGGGGWMSKDIDREFEEFVRKNYKKLSEHEKGICEKLGLKINN